ncbi:MAG: sulfatase [Gemmatimonadota bacterium]
MRSGWLVFALGWALLVSCSPDVGEDAPQTTAARTRPDVLVISVDCMRADHVGAYGYERDTTPAIDAIARDGIRFERAYAQANWTKPSVASLMTGLYVRHHGVVIGTDWFDDRGVHTVGRDSFPLPPDLPTLAESFRKVGYRTAGFIENSHIVPEMGFGRGFDVYEKAKPAADHLAAWLSELAEDEAFFAYVHLIGPHDPYDGGLGSHFREDYRTRFGRYDSEIDWTDLSYKKKVKSYTEQDLLQARALYDAELRFFDQEQIAPLLDWLRGNGRYDDTVVVVTADHGEELYEHRRWAHGETLYNAVARIPLILKLPRSRPGRRPPGSSVSELVEQIDVFPTLCAITGCPIPDGLDGRSFAALALGEREEDPDAYAVTEFGKGVRTQVLAASIVRGDAKWVEFYPAGVGPILKGPRAPKRDPDPKSVLLDAHTDEIQARVGHDVAHPLRDLLENALGDSPAIRHPLIAPVGHTDLELEELRALGYVE